MQAKLFEKKKQKELKETALTAIITPTYNKEDFTLRCFESIQKNTTLPYKIIWVDNGSDEKSRKTVKEFLVKNKIPYILVQNRENRGFVKATNQGILKALEIEAKYIIFQNNDTEVFPGWLEKYIEVAEIDLKIGLVGPVTSPSESWQAVDKLREKNENFKNLPKYNGNPEKYAKIIGEKFKGEIYDAPLGQFAFFSALAKAEMVKNIGFLSEDFGMGLGDDDDYCYRATSHFWRVVVAKDLFVFHNHRTTFKSEYTKREILGMKKRNAEFLWEKRKALSAKNAGSNAEIKILYEIIERQNAEMTAIRSSLRWLVPNYFYKRYKKYVKPYIPHFIFWYFQPLIEKINSYSGNTSVSQPKKIDREIRNSKSKLPQNIPLISVIIPSRVGEKIEVFSYLEKQTYKNLEIIIEYDYEGKGASAARNRGLKKATGEYIFFCDNDVRLAPQALENLYKKILETKAEWVFGKFKIGKDEIHNEFKSMNVPKDKKTVAFIEWFRGISTMSLIKTSAKPEFDENLKRFNDWDLWVTLYKKGCKPAFCDEILFETEFRQNGISGRGPRDALEAQKILYKKHGIKLAL